MKTKLFNITVLLLALGVFVTCASAQSPGIVYQATLMESGQKTSEVFTSELRKILAEKSAAVFDGRPFMEGQDGAQAHGERSEKKLILAPNAPAKDKPIVLVFGGSFNPIHLGHVAAAQNAMRLIRESGYKVEKVILSPAADKLVVKKLGSGAYPLAERIELARLSVQGLPDIEVSGGAATEAENFQGKLRRTQLADWAQRQCPSAAIVNMTGEDQATGPGHEPPGFPSLYTGTPGSNHAGYYYLVLALPRAAFPRPRSARCWQQVNRFHRT
jgi:cytidyltransferase-like protein